MYIPLKNGNTVNVNKREKNNYFILPFLIGFGAKAYRNRFFCRKIKVFCNPLIFQTACETIYTPLLHQFVKRAASMRQDS